jgi:hypothetical protein
MFGDPILGDPKPDTRHDTTLVHEAPSLPHFPCDPLSCDPFHWDPFHWDPFLRRRGFVHGGGVRFAKPIASRRCAAQRTAAIGVGAHERVRDLAADRHGGWL